MLITFSSSARVSVHYAFYFPSHISLGVNSLSSKISSETCIINLLNLQMGMAHQAASFLNNCLYPDIRNLLERTALTFFFFFWILLPGGNLASHWTRPEAVITPLLHLKALHCEYHHLLERPLRIEYIISKPFPTTKMFCMG